MTISEIIIPEIRWCDDPEKMGEALSHFLLEMRRQQIAVQSVHIEVEEPTKAIVIPWGIGEPNGSR